ncbi:nucleotide exchange factor GrpE [Streptosporangium sp. NPDC002721]|uniref:nucleotide exchange factor GrpE n=1 Tax=Streptosporangium sp. NPDC002721 TaxID=3366188 RepID=UPI00367CC4E6
MSETPGRDRHVPRRDGDPRGGYDPPGREPYDQERGEGRERDTGREGRAGTSDASITRDTPDASDTSNTPDASGVSDGLQDRVRELQDQVADLQDRWRRALADLDNLRKRVGRDAERTRSEERARAAGEWLPVLDNLDRALEHAGTDPGSIVDGMRAIRDQAQEVLSRLGYTRRDDEGAVFDPARHEAVGVLSQEGVPDGTVLQVVRPGYGDGERQLRPALVVVAKGA